MVQNNEKGEVDGYIGKTRLTLNWSLLKLDDRYIRVQDVIDLLWNMIEMFHNTKFQVTMYADFLCLVLDFFSSFRWYDLITWVFGIWGDLLVIITLNPEDTDYKLALKEEEDPETASSEQNLSMVNVFLEAWYLIGWTDFGIGAKGQEQIIKCQTWEVRQSCNYTCIYRVLPCAKHLTRP